MGFEVLIGKTLIKINETNKELIFHCDDNKVYKMYHEQDCCENVSIEDIIGNLDDLIGSPVTMAEMESNSGKDEDEWETYTWTFYKLATIKGYVTIRWYGTSNGYYSESVNFKDVTKKYQIN